MMDSVSLCCCTVYLFLCVFHDNFERPKIFNFVYFTFFCRHPHKRLNAITRSEIRQSIVDLTI